MTFIKEWISYQDADKVDGCMYVCLVRWTERLYRIIHNFPFNRAGDMAQRKNNTLNNFSYYTLFNRMNGYPIYVLILWLLV